MSSTEATLVAGAPPQLYFCHQCEHTVHITPPPDDGDLLCPICQSDFVEEFESPDPPPPPPLPNPFSDDLFETFARSLFSPSPSSSSSALGPADFDPFTYIHGLLEGHRARGVNFRLVVEQGGGGIGLGPGSGPGNIGDYFIGPGFEELIQQLAENDPNRYGTPPAAKTAVEGLPELKVDDDMLKSELAQCAVCKDDFELGTDVKQMPCNHVYHKECILPWLELHNSCPVCRFELPTDDPDYESQQGRSETGAGGSGGQTVVGRQFTVSLPWPAGGFWPARQGGGSGSG